MVYIITGNRLEVRLGGQFPNLSVWCECTEGFILKIQQHWLQSRCAIVVFMSVETRHVTSIVELLPNICLSTAIKHWYYIY